MPTVFTRQKRATLTDQVLKEIREAIRCGNLKPGERLIEMQLAEEMQISRFPIREALRYLEKEGLVETKPFKGSHIAQFTEKDMEAIMQRDIKRAEKAIREHLELSMRIIREGYWKKSSQSGQAAIEY
jgi:DNA-binding GntR family transcriptional regulator